MYQRVWRRSKRGSCIKCKPGGPVGRAPDGKPRDEKRKKHHKLTIRGGTGALKERSPSKKGEGGGGVAFVPWTSPRRGRGCEIQKAHKSDERSTMSKKGTSNKEDKILLWVQGGHHITGKDRDRGKKAGPKGTGPLSFRPRGGKCPGKKV